MIALREEYYLTSGLTTLSVANREKSRSPDHRMELFETRKVALISVAESLDTGSAAGRLVITIMAAVSQWERAPCEATLMIAELCGKQRRALCDT